MAVTLLSKLPDSFSATAVGFGFLAASVVVVALLGGYTIAWQPISPARTLAFAIALNIGAAVCEELTFRGFLLQGIERVSSPIAVEWRSASARSTLGRSGKKW